MFSWKHSVLYLLIILFLGVLYIYGANRQLRIVNIDMESNDQSAYMNYTRRLIESGYSFHGGGNRMPLYPLLQSAFYNSQDTDELFFTKGKYVNVALSIILLICVFLIVRSKLKWDMMVNFMLITSFSVFMFKAPYFQAELLFYFLTFVLFLSMLRLLREPTVPVAVFAGFIAGLAFLTKASVFPSLFLFFFFLGILSLYEFLGKRRLMPIKEAFRGACRYLVVVPIVSILFLITVFPQIDKNKKTFGRYFYNVNTTFYMWYDSWGEVKEGTRARGDRVGWPDMAAEDIPSMEKYFDEHSPAQILGRFKSGIFTTITRMSSSYGYFKYLVIYLGLLLLVSVWMSRQTIRSFKESPFIILFVLFYMVSYFLLYAWYTWIASGNRFVLSLFLPFMFSVLSALQVFEIPPIRLAKIGKIEWNKVVNVIVLAILSVDVYLMLSRDIIKVYGGH